jgi:hypothetical protein
LAICITWYGHPLSKLGRRGGRGRGRGRGRGTHFQEKQPQVSDFRHATPLALAIPVAVFRFGSRFILGISTGKVMWHVGIYTFTIFFISSVIEIGVINVYV